MTELLVTFGELWIPQSTELISRNIGHDNSLTNVTNLDHWKVGSSLFYINSMWFKRSAEFESVNSPLVFCTHLKSLVQNVLKALKCSR